MPSPYGSVIIILSFINQHSPGPVSKVWQSSPSQQLAVAVIVRPSQQLAVAAGGGLVVHQIKSDNTACAIATGARKAAKKELENTIEATKSMSGCSTPRHTRSSKKLGSRIWGQKMDSKGTKLAESERGVWFWLEIYGGKRFRPQILEPRQEVTPLKSAARVQDLSPVQIVEAIESNARLVCQLQVRRPSAF